ncbi:MULTISPECIES: hypothetical protein [Metallosphaera]|uniref:hypothetical protein n=1 Tax=Metallosphaera TaxID=41980 RepID=UPI001F05F481|nr:hypothetical protein [Metallosphaera sedula]MCH1771250.1 hypothetical protein [Metallosphaera sedula]MCP6729622.1 hypothetical protein [Metallosphaera sedula]
MAKLRTFFVVASVVILVGLTGYFIFQSLIPNSEFIPTYNVSYGVYTIPVYSHGSISYETIKGLKLVIDNEDNNTVVRISSISNSSFSTTPSVYYYLESVPLSNGSIASAYAPVYEIYVGYDTLIIPVNLSPGQYNIVLTDGNQFSFTVTSNVST